MRTLYPDTSYSFESGGDPQVIPELSYEQFQAFHQKYYHPANSYIYLYGNMDMEDKLNWMDREYLGKFDAISVDSQVKEQKPLSICGKLRFRITLQAEKPLRTIRTFLTM